MLGRASSTWNTRSRSAGWRALGAIALSRHIAGPLPRCNFRTQADGAEATYTIRRKLNNDTIWDRKLDAGRPLVVLSRKALAVQNKLRSRSFHPSEILRSSIAEGDVPVDVIALCLDAAFQDMKALPRKCRSEAIMKNPIAGMTLSYLWEHTDLWVTIVHGQDERWLNHYSDHDSNFETCFRLAYFAIGEGHQGYHGPMVQWLKTRAPSDFAFSNAQDHDAALHSDSWRGFLLRNLVQAHLMLATVPSADKALSLLFDIVEEKARVMAEPGDEKHPLGSLSVWPAIVQLSQQLGAGSFPKTDSRDYDNFVRFVLDYKKTKPENRELDVAKLQLHHPRTPTSNYAVRYLQKHFANKSADECGLLLPSDPK